MTNQEHNQVLVYIEKFLEQNKKHPSHLQILKKMLEVSSEVTYRDGMEYGLGSTFRSRLSDLRKNLTIISYPKDVRTRYGSVATIQAHKLEVSA